MSDHLLNQMKSIALCVCGLRVLVDDVCVCAPKYDVVVVCC